MLRNYFRIALRNLRRNTVYSFINIAGLSVGIASSILILLWVYNETTFNSYFKKVDVLYRVKLNNKVDNGIVTGDLTPLPLKDVIAQQDSRIKRTAMMIHQAALLSVGETKINKVGLDVTDSFLEMFDFEMIYGNPKTVLNDPRSIVLTQSTAKALFGNEDPMGKTVMVKIENNEPLKVSGIIADPPANISFSFSFVLPFAYFESTAPWIQYAKTNWNNNTFDMFVELQRGADKEGVDRSIRGLIKKYGSEERDTELFLHAMTRWRLYNNFENGKESGGLIDYVRLFSGIAVFILVIACINFMNLSTARSEHRAREVGIRKSIGSSRKELILQFIGESLLISGIAFAVSIVLTELALPFYNDFVNKKLTIDFTSSLFWTFGISLVLLTGLLAGSYPAFYLSSFDPAKVLKGKMKAGKGASTPRKVLVTLQFGFTILLIIGTVVVYQQIHYLRNRETGYNRENLMMLWSNTDIERNFRPLKQELISTGAALSVCKSNSPITRIFASSPLESWTGMRPGQRIEATNIATEYDYTETMGIRMIEGRDFSEYFKSDTTAILLNKTAVNVLNLSNPVGDKIKMWGQWWNIIGIMDDVLMGSGSSHIEPLVMTMDPTWSTTISVRLAKTPDLVAAIKRVEEVFKKYNPDYPFEYRFADTEFEQKFNAINMISRLAGTFAVLAIFITGLGLFGMAAFTAEQRTKEIGIRKTMGASVSSLVLMLTGDFSRLVLAAFAISAPVAWWATADFLQQYQVRIEMPWWVFPMAGIVSLAITVVIVSTQAIRAAVRNPVESLRTE